MRNLTASWRAARRHRGQNGQTLIIMAFLSVFLITLLGLVVDSVRLYVLSAQAERAAEAAALAGALYMPNYFNTASPDGQDAVLRACAVLKQNGITNCPAAAGQVGAQVSTVATNQYEIQVTVTLQTDVFFLAFVAPNLSTTTVSRSALAQFLPPIELGSRYPYFGDEADGLQNFWAFINGPSELQEHGDAYTPSQQEGPTDPQQYPDGGSFRYSRWNGNVCCTNHQQWPEPITNPDQQPAGFTGADGNPGYNYQIVIPQGAPSMEVQIYNPAFDPTDSATNPTIDGLDSACLDPAYNNCATTDNANEYMQMSYSLYKAPLQFERSTDTFLTSKSYPSLDLYKADLTKHGCSVAYNPVAKTCATPGYIDGWEALPDSTGLVPLLLGPGTYRLVVEATGTYGRHGYSIKLTNAITGQIAPSNSGYGVWGWNNMCVRFNITGGTAVFDLGEIPAAYAGKTLNFSLFDPGDASGNVTMDILNPSGTAVQLPSWVRTQGNNGVDLLASSNGDAIYNGLWLKLPITIPANYNPTAGNDWWTIKYVATGTPGDTITISISLSGSPIHLVNEIP
jgi:hypothetical protein